MIRNKFIIQFALGFAAALMLVATGTGWCADEATGQDQDVFECIGAYGGLISGAVRQGHYLYLAQGSTLRTLDIADPEHPIEGGFVKNLWDISRMILNGPALYLVIDREGVGVRVVDISDPMRPRRRGDFGGEGYNLHARMMGSFLGVGDWSKLGHWYEILDVRDPLRPKSIFDGDPKGTHRQAFVTDGKRIYFGERLENENGNEPYRHRIFDGNTSRTLGILRQPSGSYGSLDFRIENGVLVAGGTDTSATIPLLKVKKGDHFWVSCDSESDAEVHAVKGAALEDWWGGDDEDAETKAPEPDARRALEAYKRSLQFMGRVTAIKVADKKGYASDGEGMLTVLDLSDPDRPRGIARLVLPGLAGVEAVEENLVFDCNMTSGALRVIDCAKPEAPRLVGTYHGALGPMVSSATRLYVAAEGGLKILDISKPDGIKELGKFPTPEACTSLATSGTLVFLYAKDLYVVDASDPAAPKLVNKTPVALENETIDGSTGRESYLMKKLGNYLYLTASGDNSVEERSEFVIVDVANPAAPRVFKEKSKNKPKTPARFEGWFLGVPWGYRNTFDRSHGVDLYDLADPERPRKSGYFHELVSHPTVLYKDVIYLADGENGLVIIKRK